MGIRNFINNWITPKIDKVKYWLVQTTCPHQTALTLTVGFYLGLFPVFGSTTLLCFLATFLFRLNPLIIQGVNLLLYPFNILFMYPFLKAGRMLFFARQDLASDVSFGEIIHSGSWNTISYLFESVAGGIAIWGILFAVTGFFMYRVLFRIASSYNSAW